MLPVDGDGLLINTPERGIRNDGVGTLRDEVQAVAGVDVAALDGLIMNELIGKERCSASTQRDRRMVVKGCLNSDYEVVTMSPGASDGWRRDGGSQGNGGRLVLLFHLVCLYLREVVLEFGILIALKVAKVRVSQALKPVW